VSREFLRCAAACATRYGSAVVICKNTFRQNFAINFRIVPLSWHERRSRGPQIHSLANIAHCRKVDLRRYEMLVHSSQHPGNPDGFWIILRHVQRLSLSEEFGYPFWSYIKSCVYTLKVICENWHGFSGERISFVRHVWTKSTKVKSEPANKAWATTVRNHLRSRKIYITINRNHFDFAIVAQPIKWTPFQFRYRKQNSLRKAIKKLTATFICNEIAFLLRWRKLAAQKNEKTCFLPHARAALLQHVMRHLM